MTLTFRDTKGTPLTVAEADANVRTLRDATTAAQQTADNAQPKVVGKGLSTNDYDATEKAKVAAAIPSSQKGAASGVATLGADGKLPVSQLPPLAVNEVFTVGSQAAMLALTAERGDIALRTDQGGQAYILGADAPSNIGNWLLIKQNLGVALTALGALTPAVDTIDYFNGTATAATTAFTAKARLLLARADTAGMQTELGLVPATSASDPLAGRVALVGQAGMGSYTPISMPNTESADTLPPINARFVFGNGGSALPYSYVFIDQFATGNAGWTRQIAYAVNDKGIWERFFVNGSATGVAWTPIIVADVIPVTQGGTGVTTLPVPFTRLRDYQPLTYAEAAAERIRMKIFEPINFVVDVDDVSTAQVRGPGYVTVSTTGTKPGNGQYAYGVLETILISGDVANQKFTPLSGGAGVTFPEYRRTGYGLSATRWGPWRMVIDESSALLNPSNGGILSRTVVGGIALTKYLDGRNIANGIFTTATAVLSTGATVVSITLPFSIGADDSFSNASVSALPSVAYDSYGVIGEYITNSGTVLNVAIRNGATAQAFKIAGTITGHWK